MNHNGQQLAEADPMPKNDKPLTKDEVKQKQKTQPSTSPYLPGKSPIPSKKVVEMAPSFEIKQTRTQKLQGMTKSPNPNEAAVAKKKLDQKQAKEPKLPTLNDSYAPVTEGVAFLKREKKNLNRNM